jgi:hypothetical protein
MCPDNSRLCAFLGAVGTVASGAIWKFLSGIEMGRNVEKNRKLWQSVEGCDQFDGRSMKRVCSNTSPAIILGSTRHIVCQWWPIPETSQMV